MNFENYESTKFYQNLFISRNNSVLQSKSSLLDVYILYVHPKLKLPFDVF